MVMAQDVFFAGVFKMGGSVLNWGVYSKMMGLRPITQDQMRNERVHITLQIILIRFSHFITSSHQPSLKTNPIAPEIASSGRDPSNQANHTSTSSYFLLFQYIKSSFPNSQTSLQIERKTKRILK